MTCLRCLLTDLQFFHRFKLSQPRFSHRTSPVNLESGKGRAINILSHYSLYITATPHFCSIQVSPLVSNTNLKTYYIESLKQLFFDDVNTFYWVCSKFYKYPTITSLPIIFTRSSFTPNALQRNPKAAFHNFSMIHLAHAHLSGIALNIT